MKIRNKLMSLSVYSVMSFAIFNANAIVSLNDKSMTDDEKKIKGK